MSRQDLQNSLASSLFSYGLTDIWCSCLADNCSQSYKQQEYYQWHDLFLAESLIGFGGKFNCPENNYPIAIKTAINLKNAQTLLLSPQEIQTIPELPIKQTENIPFDLGEQVTITHLEITSEYLLIKGTMTVFP